MLYGRAENFEILNSSAENFGILNSSAENFGISYSTIGKTLDAHSSKPEV